KLRSTPTVHPAHVRRREPKLGLVARSTDVSRQVAPRTQRLQRGQPLNASHLVKRPTLVALQTPATRTANFTLMSRSGGHISGTRPPLKPGQLRLQVRKPSRSGYEIHIEAAITQTATNRPRRTRGTQLEAIGIVTTSCHLISLAIAAIV